MSGDRGRARSLGCAECAWEMPCSPFVATMTSCRSHAVPDGARGAGGIVVGDKHAGHRLRARSVAARERQHEDETSSPSGGSSTQISRRVPRGTPCDREPSRPTHQYRIRTMSRRPQCVRPRVLRTCDRSLRRRRDRPPQRIAATTIGLPAAVTVRVVEKVGQHLLDEEVSIRRAQEIGMSRTTVRSSKDGRRSVMTSSRDRPRNGERRTSRLLLDTGHVEQIAHESGEAVGLHVDEPEQLVNIFLGKRSCRIEEVDEANLIVASGVRRSCEMAEQHASETIDLSRSSTRWARSRSCARSSAIARCS